MPGFVTNLATKSAQADFSDHLIYTPYDNYALRSVNEAIGDRAHANYEIEIYDENNSTPQDKAADAGEKVKKFITSWTIEEDEQMISMATLNFQNPEFAVSKNGLLKEGQHVVIRWGYGSNLTDNNLRFRLVRSEPQFPGSKVPVYTVKGYDGRYAMINEDFIGRKRYEESIAFPGSKRRKGLAKTRSTFPNMQDWQIVDAIAHQLGYCTSLHLNDDKKKRTRVKKKSTSNWAFILEFAKRSNYTCWCEWDKKLNKWCICWREKEAIFRPNLGGYEFNYGIEAGAQLIDFFPQRETVRQPTDIEVVHFDRKLRKVNLRYWSQTKANSGIPANPVDPDERVNDYGAMVKFRLEGRLIKTYSRRPLKSKKDAQDFATWLLAEYQTDFMPGKGKLIGIENVRPRQIHKLNGIDIYSGEYYFTQVKHQFIGDSVYTNDFVGYRIMPQELRDLIRRGQVVSKFKAE